MRYLILSDIHANNLALETVLRHARRKRWDKVIFLGDAVGYYTQPNEVVTQLRELDPVIKITGNHEDLLTRYATGDGPPGYKEDSIVVEVIQNHVKALSPENFSYLQTFGKRAQRDGWEVTHGGLRSPWEYLSTLQNAQDNAPFMKTDLCFIGHTHVPKVFACVKSPSGDIWRTMALRGESSLYRIPPRAKIIFNPGSVGQPRGGVPQSVRDVRGRRSSRRSTSSIRPATSATSSPATMSPWLARITTCVVGAIASAMASVSGRPGLA